MNSTAKKKGVFGMNIIISFPKLVVKRGISNTPKM